MKNKEALTIVNNLIISYNEFTAKRYKKLHDKLYYAIYGEWDRSTWYALKDLFFNLVTGEPSFEAFYNRFDAPATAKGDRAVAWETRFIPDLMCDNMFDSKLGMEERVKLVKKDYNKCIKLEKEFKKKRK